LETKRGDRCHFEEIKYVFPIFHQYFEHPVHESTIIERSTLEMQHDLLEGKLVNDYIKVPAYRTSFSSASKVATLDDAHTLDLRPAFSLFWFEGSPLFCGASSRMQENSSDDLQYDKGCQIGSSLQNSGEGCRMKTKLI
jgi:hypothetical protein